MCDSGFISIVDPFLNPDGSQWTGSITYTLLYATTVAGATVVNAEQQFNVVNGINICLAPGLYRVVLQQNGFVYSITTSWGVPASGGPYTVAEIQGNVTLQAASAVLMAKTVLTEAQVLALHTTPVAVVPAPGAEFVIQPLSINVNQAGSASYSVAGDGSLFFGLGANLLAQLEIFGGSSGFANFLYSINPDQTFDGDASGYANLPLIASTTANPTGTGGNVTITVLYAVVPIS